MQCDNKHKTNINIHKLLNCNVCFTLFLDRIGGNPNGRHLAKFRAVRLNNPLTLSNFLYCGLRRLAHDMADTIKQYKQGQQQK